MYRTIPFNSPPVSARTPLIESLESPSDDYVIKRANGKRQQTAMSIQTRSQESYESVDTSGYLQKKMALDRQSDDVNFLRDAIWSRAPRYSISYVEDDLYRSIEL